MKKLISIFNITLFLFISHIIFQEFIESDGFFPSPLYDRAEHLGNISSFYREPLWNIVFTYISVVILSFLIFIISLFFREIKNYFYILSSVCNFIIAIPIFNMYKNILSFNPFYFLEHSYKFISPWALYIFSSTLSGIFLAMYLLFNRTRHLFKETTIYKFKKISLISIGLIFIFYCLNCAYLSFKIKNIADESYTTYGEVNKFSDDISDLNFLRMSIRDNYDKDKITYEKKWCSFPITLIFLNKAKSWYWYEYKSNLNSARTDLHFPVIVDLELKNFRWIITNVFDHP